MRKTMKDYLIGLNESQREAVLTTEGPVLILAGAGSGKTHTLINRVSHIIDNGISPEHILLLTFTNKAAKEMKDRIIHNLGEKGSEVIATTFHSFCARFLRKHIAKLGMHSNFTIIDEEDSADVIDIVKSVPKYDLVTSYKDFPNKKKILSFRSKSLNFHIPFSECIPKSLVHYRDTIIAIVDDYNHYKMEHNLVDYDDLLLHVISLMKTYEEIRLAMEKKFDYIMCDEYQDTNFMQDEILSLLRMHNKNLAVVGDDNQSIYRFRGANIENILTFESRYNNTKKIILSENYRSSEEIVGLSNHIMKYAKEGYKKDLHAQFQEGAKPYFVTLRDGNEEIDFIINQIKSFQNLGIDLNKMAVIIRSAWQSNKLEALLTKENIAYKKFGGQGFLSSRIAKDILAFFRILVNHRDEIAWFRVLTLFPGIGNKKANDIIAEINFNGLALLSFHIPELYDFVSNNYDSVETTMKYVLHKYVQLRYQEFEKSRRKNVDEEREAFERSMKDATDVFLDLASQFNSEEAFLEGLSLDSKDEKNNRNQLNITTIHSAKGLEYEIVFVMDCIDTIFPQSKNENVFCNRIDEQGFHVSHYGLTMEDSRSLKEDAEEMRCFYVAITRAKRMLFLLYSKTLFRHGKLVSENPSHYLLEKDISDYLTFIEPN